MFTSIADFEKRWKDEMEGTEKVLAALTDASLAQAVSADDRTLGRIAWHVATTIPEMLSQTGLKPAGPAPDAPVPASAAAILDAYRAAASSLLEQVRTRWQDATLATEDEMYGERWARGFTLSALVLHQAHHRGQMTVLMRQAGLRVPGVYGPAREEWKAMGMAAPAV